MHTDFCTGFQNIDHGSGLVYITGGDLVNVPAGGTDFLSIAVKRATFVHSGNEHSTHAAREDNDTGSGRVPAAVYEMIIMRTCGNGCASMRCS